MTEYAPSGGFRNSVYKLKSVGIIDFANKMIKLVDANRAIEIVGDYETEEYTLESWLKHSNLSVQEKKIFEFLLNRRGEEAYPISVVADSTGYISSGGFRNSVYRLKSLGLIEKNKNDIKINSEFEEF